MIVKNVLVVLGFTIVWFCIVSGAPSPSYSKVYVRRNAEATPVEYVNYEYGAPALRLSAPLTSASVVPCVSPCVVPGTSVAAVAPLNANLVYNSPISNVPVILPSNNDDKLSYEYSYVVYDDNSGDQKQQRELSDGSVVHGQYSLIQPDGYVREVKYTADDVKGFNAVVRNFLPTHSGEKKEESQEKSNEITPCREVKNEVLTEELGESDESSESGEKELSEKESQEKGSHEKPSHEKESIEKTSHEKAPNAKRSREKESHEKGSHEKGTHEKVSHEKGSHGKGSHERPSHEKGSHERASHEKGFHERASHEKESHEKNHEKKEPGGQKSHEKKSEESVEESHEKEHKGHEKLNHGEHSESKSSEKETSIHEKSSSSESGNTPSKEDSSSSSEEGESKENKSKENHENLIEHHSKEHKDELESSESSDEKSSDSEEESSEEKEKSEEARSAELTSHVHRQPDHTQHHVTHETSAPQYNDLIRCIQSFMEKTKGTGHASGSNSPLTYVLLPSAPC